MTQKERISFFCAGGWYGFNRGDTVGRDGPVDGGEWNTQEDN